MLCVADEIFAKGDKVRVLINKEVTGVISSIGEEDVIFKTKGLQFS